MDLNRIRRLVLQPTPEVLLISFLAGLYSIPAGFALLQLNWSWLSWLPGITPVGIATILSGCVLTLWVTWQLLQRLPQQLSWFDPTCRALNANYARLQIIAAMTATMAGLGALIGPLVGLGPWLGGLSLWYFLVAAMAFLWAYLHYPVVAVED